MSPRKELCPLRHAHSYERKLDPLTFPLPGQTPRQGKDGDRRLCGFLALVTPAPLAVEVGREVPRSLVQAPALPHTLPVAWFRSRPRAPSISCADSQRRTIHLI